MAVLPIGRVSLVAVPMCQTCEGRGEITINGQPYDEGDPGDPITCPSWLPSGPW